MLCKYDFCLVCFVWKCESVILRSRWRGFARGRWRWLTSERKMPTHHLPEHYSLCSKVRPPKIMRALYLLFKLICADGHLLLRQNCKRDPTVFRELVLLVEYKKFSFYLLSYNAEFLRFQINLSPLPGPINTNVEVLRGFLIFQNIQSSPTAANWQM